MKLLIVTDQVDYPNAVNPILSRRLAGQLAAEGHAVQLLELWDGVHPLPPTPEGVVRTALAFTDEYQMNEALEHGRPGTPAAVKLSRLAVHPAGALAAFRHLVLHRPRRQAACKAMLEQLEVRSPSDAVIAVGAPYLSAFALAEAKLSAKKAVWLMDPYSANKEYAAPGGAQRECAMYRRMDRVFITRLMVPDYESGPLQEAQPKTRVLEFPCLVAGKALPTQPHEGIRLAFIGNLHPEIRAPWPLLDLLCRVEDSSVSLTMAGGGWESFDRERLQKIQQQLGSRLTIAGQLPPEKALMEMAKADVLVNIGNTVANQLPSKIFDYFSTGKPVLQLAQCHDDPANNYFSRYPLGLVLNTDQPDGASVLAEWLHRVQGQRLTFPQVERLFYENTPHAVADALLRGLTEELP